MIEPDWIKITPTANIQWHKKNVTQNILSNFPEFNHKRKVIEHFLPEDTDTIPKVLNAGLVVDDPKQAYQIMHNGLKLIKLGLHDISAALIIYGLRGHYEPQKEKVFHEILKLIPSNSTMIEFGGAWGYYSLWFAAKVENGQAILIEPDYDRLEVSAKNFQFNRKMGIFIHGHVGPQQDLATRGKPIHFDSLMQQMELEHVAILSADIQGDEIHLLATAIESLKSGKIDYLFLSTHSEQIRLSCINFLEQNGYAIIATHSYEESYSYDGLIVAKRQGFCGPDYIPVSKKPSGQDMMGHW